MSSHVVPIDPDEKTGAADAPMAKPGQFMAVQPIKMEHNPPSGTQYNDWPFAILFGLMVIGIFTLMGGWGIPRIVQHEISDEIFKLIGILIGIGFGAAFVSLLISLAVIAFLFRHPEFMIKLALAVNVGITLVCVIMGVLVPHLMPVSILGMLMLVLMLCYMWSLIRRIPFAAANLRVAGAAVSKHKALFCLATTIAIVQMIWAFAWLLAYVGVITISEKKRGTKGLMEACETSSECHSLYCGNGYCTTPRQSSSSTAIISFAMTVALYWGSQVFKNISHTTVSGTVGAFWYNQDSGSALSSALKRSCTTSFGSICLGSLLVAILQAIRSAIKNSERRGGGSVVAYCMLGCLENIMRYINRWAFVYVAIYGTPFMKAGSSVFQLFESRGFTTIMNDDLISIVLGFCALGVGLISAGLGAAIGYLVNSDGTTAGFGALVGFVMGICVSLVPLSVVESAVLTIFVCFTEDPTPFYQSHQELFLTMANAWRQFHPDMLAQVNCNY